LAGFFGIINDEGCDALNQRMAEALFNGCFTPTQIFFRAFAAFAFIFISDFQQTVRGIFAAVEDHIFDALFQFFGNF